MALKLIVGSIFGVSITQQTHGDIHNSQTLGKMLAKKMIDRMHFLPSEVLS